MNKKLYKVRLEGLTSTMYAFNEEQATILVQAEAIKQGKDYKLIYVEIIN